MKAQMAKWGHSLAVRIPKTLAAAAGLSPGTEVNISLSDGRIVLQPVRPAYTL